MSAPRTSYGWTPLFATPNGHKFFTARFPQEGRIAVADQSGLFPEHTDDGVLWVDTTKPLAASDEYFSIPLVDEDGNESRTFATATEALRLAVITGQSILAKGGLVFKVSQA